MANNYIENSEIKEEKNGSKTQKDFTRIVKGRNWATPTLKFYTRIRVYAIEVSSGKSWFDASTVYGVTVANTETQENEVELGNMFFSMQEVESYLSTLLAQN